MTKRISNIVATGRKQKTIQETMRLQMAPQHAPQPQVLLEEYEPEKDPIPTQRQEEATAEIFKLIPMENTHLQFVPSVSASEYCQRLETSGLQNARRSLITEDFQIDESSSSVEDEESEEVEEDEEQDEESEYEPNLGTGQNLLQTYVAPHEKELPQDDGDVADISDSVINRRVSYFKVDRKLMSSNF